MKRMLFLATAVLALSGCGHTVYLTTTKVVAPEDHLLVDCQVVAPPPADAYKQATTDKREELLFDMNDKQLLSITSCNVRLQELRTWKQKQLQIQNPSTVEKVK